MRTLYETYQPAGLEIISIHTPTEDVNAVRRFAHEYRMDYPIAVDSPGKEMGVTSQGFRVTGYPCALLVDHEGGVHRVGESKIGGGRLVQTLVPLLEKAGAKDVRRISLDLPILSREMDNAVTEALPKWVAAAPAKGTIRGRIVDGQGRPIVGANVDGSLKLTLPMRATPGGYQVFPHPRHLHAVTVDDGAFEISGMTKGVYALKVTAPGRAWLEHDVAIGPDLKPQVVLFFFDQGDAIAGLVATRPAGRSPAADVDPTKWHHHDAIGGEVYRRPPGKRRHERRRWAIPAAFGAAGTIHVGSFSPWLCVARGREGDGRHGRSGSDARATQAVGRSQAVNGEGGAIRDGPPRQRNPPPTIHQLGQGDGVCVDSQGPWSAFAALALHATA